MAAKGKWSLERSDYINALTIQPQRKVIVIQRFVRLYGRIISRTGRQNVILLFYITLISIDLAQYEIFRATRTVGDIWQE